MLALKPRAPIVACHHKRDYERAKELAEEHRVRRGRNRDLSTVHRRSRTGKPQRQRLAADRRAKSLLQGYTGNSCSRWNFTMVLARAKCDTCGAEPTVQLIQELGEMRT